VGKHALEGLPGVKKVTSGFRSSREINTVTYDPDQVTPEKMIEALKKADTFIGVAD
jgi:copper chaperone CopZ